MGKPYIRQVEVIGLVERLGRVLLFDDLEDLFKFDSAGTGTDWVVEKNTTGAFDQNASLHLITKATTPTAGDFVSAWRRFPVPYGKKISLECLFRFETLTNEDYVQFNLEWYSEIGMIRALVRYDPILQKWVYEATDGTIKDVPNGSQKLHNVTFHRMRLLADFDKMEYISLQCNDLLMDMSGIGLRYSAASYRSRMAVAFKTVAETAARAEIYIDDVLVKEE